MCTKKSIVAKEKDALESLYFVFTYLVESPLPLCTYPYLVVKVTNIFSFSYRQLSDAQLIIDVLVFEEIYKVSVQHVHVA